MKRLIIVIRISIYVIPLVTLFVVSSRARSDSIMHSDQRIHTEILRIKNIDNKLFRCQSNKNTNKCTKIFPVTESLFLTEGEQHASMAFIKTLDGSLYLQTDFGNYQKIAK